MQYHLERTTRFAVENEFQRLYPWTLQEFHADGREASAKFIPWRWSLYFTATDASYTVGSEIAHNESDLSKYTRTERIALVVRPDGRRATQFSMFGTSRRFDTATVGVHCLPDDGSSQRCHAWGFVSYTSDYPSETQPDALGFEVWLAPTHYADIRDLVKNGTGEFAISFSVSGVEGFYAEWSPDITASHVKILTATDEHRIASPADVALPRLRDVAQFRLLVQRRMTPVPWEKPRDEPAATETVDATPPPKRLPEAGLPQAQLQSLITEVRQSRAKIGLLQWPLWIAAAAALLALVLHK